jgi:hypothetical protein
LSPQSNPDFGVFSQGFILRKERKGHILRVRSEILGMARGCEDPKEKEETDGQKAPEERLCHFWPLTLANTRNLAQEIHNTS